MRKEELETSKQILNALEKKCPHCEGDLIHKRTRRLVCVDCGASILFETQGERWAFLVMTGFFLVFLIGFILGNLI